MKSAIRKKIGKKEGDWVHVVLFADNAPTEIPEELLLCLKDDPGAYKTFLSYSDGEQKAFIEWIYSAKTDETKVERIAQMLDKPAKHKKLHDK